MKQYLLAKHQLHPNNNGEMNYCPYCLKGLKDEKVSFNFRDILHPLTYFKFLEVAQTKDGKEYKAINEYWECDRCTRKLTPEDFSKVYGDKPTPKEVTNVERDSASFI